MKRGNFAKVQAGLEGNRDARLAERARLKVIADAIAGLPEVVKPMAQKLMFTTRMSADEILAAARCAPGGGGAGGPSIGDAQLTNLGRAEAERLLGKVEDPFITFAPVEPNVYVPDLDSPLAKAGAAMAKMLKDAGYLGSAVSGPGRMA